MSSMNDLIKKYIQDHPNNEEAQKLLEDAKDSADKPPVTLKISNDKVTGLTWWFRVKPKDEKEPIVFVGTGAAGTENGHGYFTGTDIPEKIKSIGANGTFTLTMNDGGNQVTVNLVGANLVRDEWNGKGSSINVPDNSNGNWTRHS
ncbi:hypothetical protein PQX77_011852 [Marasmius sp. AFHP31]|nr:hypothetical protein PQX77_011852 [Marasmius sp. AFHP31]